MPPHHRPSRLARLMLLALLTFVLPGRADAQTAPFHLHEGDWEWDSLWGQPTPQQGSSLAPHSLHTLSYDNALWPSEWQADSAFLDVWSRVDAPVALGSVARSWLWGPVPFAVANEAYAQSATGKRLVEYLDKGRMEVNDPAAERSSSWFVTSGLLVYEMVTGRLQVGNNEFEQRKPSDLPVAGDSASPNAPTYATYAGLTAPVTATLGMPANRIIGKDGTLAAYTPPGDAAPFKIAAFDEVSRHNVPKVFVDWLAQDGMVMQGGRLAQGRLIDPLFVLGRPITEAYWATVLVGGKPATVLVQLFERRALTYNPANAPEWRVEMANVGRAYFAWRYGDTEPGGAISAEPATDGVGLCGWNWAAGVAVQLAIMPEGGGTALSTAQAHADGGGHFCTTAPYVPPIQTTLQSGGRLRVTAQSGADSTALPLAGKPPAGTAHLEGEITMVETSQGNTHLTLTSFDGKQSRLVVPPGATLLTSEATPASVHAIDAGYFASVEAASAQGVATVSSMKLMSLSRTPARVGFEWQGDGSIFVAGTGWPGEKAVAFFTGTVEGKPVQFAALKADSRGNIGDTIKPPPGLTNQQGGWVFATSSDVAGSVQVAIPVAALGRSSTNAAAQLYIIAHEGAEVGGLGSYCAQGKCFPLPGLVLPVDALAVRAGDTLGLRAQMGTNPLFAPSATSLSAQLYLLPAGVQPDEYYVAKGSPVFSTGELPGRPFSLTLPAKLAAGRYAMIVTVQWPDDGGKNSGTYGFTVQVP